MCPAPAGSLKLSTELPDLVAAVYGNGNAEVRFRGTDTVIASASDINLLTAKLREALPDGFMLDVRYDPHM